MHSTCARPTGHDQDALVPRLVETLRTTKIVGLACGSEHSVAVTDQGQVYAWGFGRMGCLGTGDFNDRLVPTKCVGLDDVHVNTICCGWRHTIFVSDKGHGEPRARKRRLALSPCLARGLIALPASLEKSYLSYLIPRLRV